MEIYGIERHFKLTVGAYREVAAMLPGGNIEELGAALTSDDPFRTMTMKRSLTKKNAPCPRSPRVKVVLTFLR